MQTRNPFDSLADSCLFLMCSLTREQLGALSQASVERADHRAQIPRPPSRVDVLVHRSLEAIPRGSGPAHRRWGSPAELQETWPACALWRGLRSGQSQPPVDSAAPTAALPRLLYLLFGLVSASPPLGPARISGTGAARIIGTRIRFSGEARSDAMG